MYLVMQYVEHGPLVSLAPDGTTSRTVAPCLLAHYARQLCAGLQYLHKHGVIHRDIKPDNILLGANDQVYLADFGVADLFDSIGGDDATDPAASSGSPTEAFGRSVVMDTRGTLAFMPPEVLNPDAHECDGQAVDVWALGVTLYALLYGRLPWLIGESRSETIHAIRSNAIEYPSLAGRSPAKGLNPDNNSDDHPSPNKNINANGGVEVTDGVIATRHFHNAVDPQRIAHDGVVSILRRMLTADPAQRASVRDCRKAFRDLDEILQEQDDGGDAPRVAVDGVALQPAESEVITKLRS